MNRLVAITLLVSSMLMTACTNFFTNETQPNSTAKSASYVEESSISGISDLAGITYYRLTKLLSPNDRICVLRAKDATDGVNIYKNSGSYISQEFYKNFAQHGPNVYKINAFNINDAQYIAKEQSCNILVEPKLAIWVDKNNQYNMASTVSMYDAGSLNLLNKAVLSTAANGSTLFENQISSVLDTYILVFVHKLYIQD